MFRTAAALLILTACAAFAQSQRPDPVVQKLIADVSADRIGVSVRKLVGFGTRGNDSDPNQKDRGIGAARRWIFAEFRSYNPRLEVSYDTGKKGTTDITSVVAVLPGTVNPEKRILIAAHYDSINVRVKGAKAAEAPAPGADDNASGTSVVLELARVMSRYRFQKTIIFVAFAGEEIGLLGSTRYAARAQASHEQIEAVLNNDIVGANVVGVIHNDVDGSDEVTADSDGDTGNRLRIYSPEPPQSPSRQLARRIQEAARRYVPRLNIDLMSTADRYDRGGDQIPFQKNGFAAVRFTSASEQSSVQHTAEDLPEGVSAPFTAEVARLNGAAAATLALVVADK